MKQLLIIALVTLLPAAWAADSDYNREDWGVMEGLRPGLPEHQAHRRHRAAWTDPEEETVWFGVHYD